MKTLLTIFSFIFLSLSIQDDFTFTNGNQKAILKIDDDKRHLQWNKTSSVTFKLENINKDDITVSAPGITFKKGQIKKNILELEITPDKETFENDSLKLNLGFYDDKNKYVHHQFLILIK